MPDDVSPAPHAADADLKQLEQDWRRVTFAGTEQAQRDHIASLTPDERIVLLEALLELAEGSGALQRSRAEKQAALDRFWTPKADVSSAEGHAGGTAAPHSPAHSDPASP